MNARAVYVWVGFLCLMDMYVFFGMKDVMLYASVCESIDASVEHVFNEVKT